MHYLTAWGRTSSTPGCSGFSNRAPANNFVGYWTSGSHTLTVRHTGNYWYHHVDGVQKSSVSEASICWTPRRALWFGESWDLGDAIGGSSTNKFTISSLMYTNTEGGAWNNTAFSASSTCNYQDGPAPFNCEVAGAQSISVWTSNR